MDIGVVFPQTEIGADAGAVRAYAQAADTLGFSHALVYDHVLGADPDVHVGWRGPYGLDSTFHEPMVLFGFLAGITSMALVSGIVILPQRQTALVAKQAAEVDLLTGGRFRLGIGVGWNPVEYEALGMEFSNRGKRSEEQIAVMRRLWTEPSVTHEGSYESFRGAGIAPLPVQRPIPVWIGGQSPPAYERAGRLAEGWFPQVPPARGLEEAKSVVDAAAVAAGRDPATIGMEGRVSWGVEGVDKLVAHIGKWREAGATHVSVNTMGAGFASVDDHIAALHAVAAASGLSGR
ncbi:MAG TPA: LLM class F420-dependent oxidoreductase [Acidimicrobiales bacterium]|nr:LLM class F420-dependent oxidoreductase [Acidimicrobiales bacterium]